jgi:uncharacterized protein
MAQPDCPEFKSGRIFLHRLPSGDDVSSGIADFCRTKGIQTATFVLSGVLSRVTLGVYDPQQQVYVTHTEETAMEILSCEGNVSLKDERPCIHTTLALADTRGRILGGRLFSPSRIFSIEIALRELIGKPLYRSYDPGTGLDLWPSRRLPPLSNI